MSVPRVLAVDDSVAALQYIKASLSEHYEVVTVERSVDAVRVATATQPEIILLDLSMPELKGDELLARLKADPQLREIPVVIVSSEVRRGEECLQLGAAAFAAKPVRAPELRALVARVIAERAALRLTAGTSVLPFQVGPLSMAVPLECVDEIAFLPAAVPLGVGPSYMRELINLHGEPVALVELAIRFHVEHASDIEDRMLVIVTHEGMKIALVVDRIGEPRTFEHDEVAASADFGASAHLPASARTSLRGVARTPEGPLPIVDASAFLSARGLRVLSGALDRWRDGQSRGAP